MAASEKVLKEHDTSTQDQVNEQLNQPDVLEILEHPADFIESSEFFSWERFFATMSSDEFKKDKHYPKKNFFYGICLFCFR